MTKGQVRTIAKNIAAEIENIRTKKVTISVVKTFAASTLNTDETGRPKTMQYGQIMRDRLTSQALKHAIREAFRKMKIAHMGTRTRSLPDLAEVEMYRLREENDKFEDISDELIAEAKQKLTKFGKSDKKKKDAGEEDEKKGKKSDEKELITKQAIFFSDEDITAIAEAMLTEIVKCKLDAKTFAAEKIEKMNSLKKCVTNAISVDMALFGRMVTSEFLSNVEAAVQVSHAMSTHAAYRESDYFSCVDDMIAMGRTGMSGAAITDYKAFRSSTFYMYSAIDLGALVENFRKIPDGEQMLESVIEAYIKCFAMTYPKTGQNAFAAQPFPDMVMIEVQDGDVPTYAYHGAYETPVKTYGQNPEVVKNSIAALVKYVDQQDYAYSDVRPIRHRAYFAPGYADEIKPENSEVFGKFGDAVREVIKWIKE